jgi:hypothetical protein
MKECLVDYFKSEFKRESFLLQKMGIAITDSLVRERLNLPQNQTFWQRLLGLFR